MTELGTKNGMVPRDKFVDLIVDDHVQVLLLPKEEEEHCIFFEVYEVISWEEDFTVSTIELYLSGMIKWDGCSHINFGDEEGYLHICGGDRWRQHCLVMRALWDYAKSHIPRWDDSSWEES